MEHFNEFFEDLRSNIKLALNKDINLSKIEKLRNTPKSLVYLLTDSSNQSYVLKKTDFAEKECLIYNLAKRFNFFNTFDVLYQGKDFFITLFKENLKPAKIDDFFDSFIQFQNIAIKNSKELEKILEPREDFINKNLERAFGRLIRQKELVLNFYKDDKRIKEFIEQNTDYCSNLSKTLCLGDINDENVVLCGKNVVYFDFERALFTKPTWDLGPIIFHLENPQDIVGLVKRYSDAMKDFADPTEITKKVYSDFISNYLTVGIGVQQFEYFKHRAPFYLKRINHHFKFILEELN